MRHTSRQQANVGEEGVVDHKGVEGVQACVIHGAHQDVLVALAAQHQRQDSHSMSSRRYPVMTDARAQSSLTLTFM